MKHFIYIVVFLVIFSMCGCATLQRQQNRFEITNLVLSQTRPKGMGDVFKVDHVLLHYPFCVYFETKNITYVENGKKKISLKIIGRILDGDKILYENTQIDYEGPVRDDFDPKIHGWGYLVFFAYNYGKYRAEIEATDRFADITSKKSISFEIKGPLVEKGVEI